MVVVVLAVGQFVEELAIFEHALLQDPYFQAGFHIAVDRRQVTGMALFDLLADVFSRNWAPRLCQDLENRPSGLRDPETLFFQDRNWTFDVLMFSAATHFKCSPLPGAPPGF